MVLVDANLPTDDFARGRDLIIRADSFAAAAHAAPRTRFPAGQLRKFTDDPYIVHPRAVAKLIGEVGLPAEVVAAALLHDVLEDAGEIVSIHDLRREFGDEVTALVIEVTDVSYPEMGNRAVRKLADRNHVSLASPHGQSIKVADLIDNTKSIVEREPGFARKYLPEKRETLKVLSKADPTLLRMGWDSLVDGELKVFGRSGDRP